MKCGLWKKYNFFYILVLVYILIQNKISLRQQNFNDKIISVSRYKKHNIFRETIHL